MAVVEFDQDGAVIRNGRRIAETASVVQLFRMFPDEGACRAWLEAARWKGEPVRPHCGGMGNIS